MKQRGRKSAASLSIVSPPEQIMKAAKRYSPAGAPDHLSIAAKQWFVSVMADFALEPHHVKLLTAAAEAWDRKEQARAVLDVEGLTYLNVAGEPRVRPEIAVERDSRLAFIRALRELDLDVEAPGEGRTRPPALRSNRR